MVLPVQEGGVPDEYTDVVNVVRGDVFHGVVVGPLVDVDPRDFLCPSLGSHDRQDSGTTAHIQNLLAGEFGFHVQDGFQHQGGCCVMTGTEAHFRVNDNLVFDVFNRGVEPGSH